MSSCFPFCIPTKEQLAQIRKKYPSGTYVELVEMNDPYTKMRAGEKGTVTYVDDIGTVFVRWNCGSSLGVVNGVDRIKIVKSTHCYPVKKTTDIKSRTEMCKA